jgi:hypothetical protein
VTARQLIDAGREHVAAGRSHEAVRCFTLATADPAAAAEARSMLAAAYLLPGTQRPLLALRHARTVAETHSAGSEDLTRCAMVALCAGDPELAEQLAGRAAPDSPDAVPILAAARARLGDRHGLGRLLAGVEGHEGSPFWQRLAMETSKRRWVKETLAARRRMQADGPRRLDLVLGAVVPVWLQALVLVVAGLLAAVLPLPGGLAALGAVGGSAALMVPADLRDGRPALGWSRLAWALMATATAVAHWLN